MPTGCPRHCATLFHEVASVVFVSTDKRTSTSCYRHSDLSSESLTFSLFAGFLPVSQIGVSSTPSAFAGESESLQQQAHHQLVWIQGVMSGWSNSSKYLVWIGERCWSDQLPSADLRIDSLLGFIGKFLRR